MKRFLEVLIEGTAHTGTLREGFHYSYERFYTSDPIEDIKNFAAWVDDEIGGASKRNVEMLWGYFHNPGDLILRSQVKELKRKLELLNRL